MKNQDEVLKALMEEISVITGAPEATLSPGAPLGVNRINSLGFVELLLFIRRKWNLPANNMVKINYPHNNRRRGGYIYGSAIATPLIFYSPFSALFLTPRKIYLPRALSR